MAPNPDVILVRPFSGTASNTIGRKLFEPIGLEWIAQHLGGQGVDVRLCDHELGQTSPYELQPNIVGIQCIHYKQIAPALAEALSWHQAYRSAQIVFGGPAAGACDVGPALICEGEGAAFLSDLLNIKRPDDQIPFAFPGWRAAYREMRKRENSIAVCTSLGCSHGACSFCWQRGRPARVSAALDSVVASTDALHQTGAVIWPTDDDFLGEHPGQRANDLVAATQGSLHDCSWSIQVRAAQLTSEVCSALVKTNVRRVYVGIESAASSQLERLCKPFSASAADAICWLGNHGVFVELGLLADREMTLEELRATGEFLSSVTESDHVVIGRLSALRDAWGRSTLADYSFAAVAYERMRCIMPTAKQRIDALQWTDPEAVRQLIRVYNDAMLKGLEELTGGRPGYVGRYQLTPVSSRPLEIPADPRVVPAARARG